MLRNLLVEMQSQESQFIWINTYKCILFWECPWICIILIVEYVCRSFLSNLQSLLISSFLSNISLWILLCLICTFYKEAKIQLQFKFSATSFPFLTGFFVIFLLRKLWHNNKLNILRGSMKSIWQSSTRGQKKNKLHVHMYLFWLTWTHSKPKGSKVTHFFLSISGSFLDHANKIISLENFHNFRLSNENSEYRLNDISLLKNLWWWWPMKVMIWGIKRHRKWIAFEAAISLN